MDSEKLANIIYEHMISGDSYLYDVRAICEKHNVSVMNIELAMHEHESLDTKWIDGFYYVVRV